MSRPKRKVPWLVKRGGVYYTHWYDDQTRQTKRRSLGTSDEAEAKTRFAAFLLEGGTEPEDYAHSLSVNAALDQYWTEHVARNCADPRRQEDAILHLMAFFADTEISTVDIPMSRRYADARRNGHGGRPGTDSTIRRELNVLIAASNHARKWKRIVELPSIELTKEKVRGVDDETPYFSKDEISTMIDLAEGELRPFIQLAYWTGARRASIENLTWAQVRWDQKRILLQAPGKVATAKRQPIVPILPEMEEPLLDLKSDRPKLFSDMDFYRRFRVLCEGLGFGERSHPHLLRHSRATHLLQDGVSIYTVAKLLGDTIATIERTYGHHSNELMAEALGGK